MLRGMVPSKDLDTIKATFLAMLRQHLVGLRAKIEHDFSEESFQTELASLQGDPVYSKFAFDSPEYVVVRLVGRVSISIGRRLGAIYDTMPRFAAAARFGLAPSDVAPKLSGLELDVGLRLELLSDVDAEHVRLVAKELLGVALDEVAPNGLGIEIRYNFNPNDSARLRKDVQMAEYLQAEGLLPIYLVFSSLSPRMDAIARLGRAGWAILQGQEAIDFAHRLLDLDLAWILDDPEIKDELLKEVQGAMGAMVNSFAFQQVLGNPPFRAG